MEWSGGRKKVKEGNGCKWGKVFGCLGVWVGVLV